MGLADQGADVLKLEKPKDLDPARAFGPEPATVPAQSKGMMGSLFFTMNRNKKSMCVDFGTSDGKTVLESVLKSIDLVFVDKHNSAKELTYDFAAKANPSIIYVMMDRRGGE